MKHTPKQHSVGKESFGQFTCTSTFAINTLGLQKQHSRSKAHKTANINSTIVCISLPQKSNLYLLHFLKVFPRPRGDEKSSRRTEHADQKTSFAIKMNNSMRLKMIFVCEQEYHKFIVLKIILLITVGCSPKVNIFLR